MTPRCTPAISACFYVRTFLCQRTGNSGNDGEGGFGFYELIYNNNARPSSAPTDARQARVYVDFIDYTLYVQSECSGFRDSKKRRVPC